jgi:hypothetical protein
MAKAFIILFSFSPHLLPPEFKSAVKNLSLKPANVYNKTLKGHSLEAMSFSVFAS